MEKITVYGAILSPFVRKIRLALALKGVAYDNVLVLPVPGGDKPQEFVENSPLGKIPLLRVGDEYISGSGVMCAWLEREVPQPALLPENNMAAARALWFQEYADSRMVPVVGGHLFAEVVLAKAVFQREPIEADIEMALNVEIPEILDYLESQLQGEYLVGEELSLADIAVGGQFLTLLHCQYEIDAVRWPKVAAYSNRLLGHPVFAKTLAEEQELLSAFGA